MSKFISTPASCLFHLVPRNLAFMATFLFGLNIIETVLLINRNDMKNMFCIPTEN